jgi:phage terminase Nu1 subunit (DNA packaging protein)
MAAKDLRKLRTTTVIDAAAELGVNPETIRRYIREGCPHSRKGNKFYVYVPEVQQWMKENGRTGEQGNKAEDASPDLEAVRIRKELALARKYEIAVAREMKQLMPREEVYHLCSVAASSFRNAISGLSSKLAVMLEGRTTAERQDIIEAEHKHYLDELSRRFQAIGDGDENA